MSSFKTNVCERRKILLIGDSITQQSFSVEHCGFGAGLADWYQRSADVINRGFSGFNSLWVSQLLPRAVPEQLFRGEDCVLATVFLGANDSVVPSAGQHVPVADYRINLAKIIAYLRTINAEMKIILITPPIVDPVLWPTRHDDQVKIYAAGVRDVAAEMGTLVVDLWDTEGASIIDLADLHDGLHLGVGGNTKVLRIIQQVIESNCPELVPGDLPSGEPNMSFQFPHWSALVNKSEAETKELLDGWEW